MLGPKPCLKGHVATCTIAQASKPPPRSPGLLATGQLQALDIRLCSPHPGGFRDASAPGQSTYLPCSGWQDPSCREVPDLRTHRPAPPPAPTEPLQSFWIKQTSACCLTQWRGGYGREPATLPQQNPQSEHG